MRFDDVEREVDPLPGESGLQIVHEPIILVRFVGPAGAWLIRGLLDTGASMTLLPRTFIPTSSRSEAARAGPLNLGDLHPTDPTRGRRGRRGGRPLARAAGSA